MSACAALREWYTGAMCIFKSYMTATHLYLYSKRLRLHKYVSMCTFLQRYFYCVQAEYKLMMMSVKGICVLMFYMKYKFVLSAGCATMSAVLLCQNSLLTYMVYITV